MTNSERRDAVVIAVLAVTIALVGAAAWRSIAVVGANFAGNSFLWYLRLRLFDITTEVLALGAVAYVMPRTRLTTVAARVAAALAVVGIGAEIGEWLTEQGNRFLASEGGAVPGSIIHVSVLVALGAVVAMWYFGQFAAPDFS